MVQRKAVVRTVTNKNCKQITDLLYDYLNNELSRKVKRDFEKHLNICPDCVRFLNTYKKTVAVIRSVDAAALPTNVRQNVLAFLRKRLRKIGVFLLFVVTQLII